jgi:hypothetical protein
MIFPTCFSYGMAQAVRHCPLSAKAWVRSQARPGRIWSGKSGNGTGFKFLPPATFHQCCKHNSFTKHLSLSLSLSPSLGHCISNTVCNGTPPKTTTQQTNCNHYAIIRVSRHGSVDTANGQGQSPCDITRSRARSKAPGTRS